MMIVMKRARMIATVMTIVIRGGGGLECQAQEEGGQGEGGHLQGEEGQV